MAQKTVENWRVIFDTAQNATKTTEILQVKLSTIEAIPYAYVLSHPSSCNQNVAFYLTDISE